MCWVEINRSACNIHIWVQSQREKKMNWSRPWIRITHFPCSFRWWGQNFDWFLHFTEKWWIAFRFLWNYLKYPSIAFFLFQSCWIYKITEMPLYRFGNELSKKNTLGGSFLLPSSKKNWELIPKMPLLIKNALRCFFSCQAPKHWKVITKMPLELRFFSLGCSALKVGYTSQSELLLRDWDWVALIQGQ